MYVSEHSASYRIHSFDLVQWTRQLMESASY